MDRCLKKTILYRILAVSTMLPISFVVDVEYLNKSLQEAFGASFIVTLLVEGVVHTLIYYGIEKREEDKERKVCKACKDNEDYERMWAISNRRVKWRWRSKQK